MKNISLSLLFILSTLCSLNASAQGEANIWYFGESAGLDFNNDPPLVLTNGAMSDFEGCSSISDADGNLLFYTNGLTVWNKNHEIMMNGDGLHGNSSATQCLIVKMPDATSIYYIFTQEAQLGVWG